MDETVIDGVCVKCGSAVFDGEHLRNDLQPCSPEPRKINDDGMLQVTPYERDNIESMGDEPMVVGRATDWEYLQHIIEELQAENEELQAKNAELRKAVSGHAVGCKDCKALLS